MRGPQPVRAFSREAIPFGCPALTSGWDARELTAHLRSLSTEDLRQFVFELSGRAESVGQEPSRSFPAYGGDGGTDRNTLRALLENPAGAVLWPSPLGVMGGARYSELYAKHAFFSGSGGGSRAQEPSGQVEVDWEKVEFGRREDWSEAGAAAAGRGASDGGSQADSGSSHPGTGPANDIKPRVTAIEVRCKHAKDGPRKVGANGVLEVVPDALTGAMFGAEELTFTAFGDGKGSAQWQVVDPDGDWEPWVTAETRTHKIGGVKSPLKWVPTLADLKALFTMRWRDIQGCTPLDYAVYCQDPHGTKLHATVRAFPGVKYSFSKGIEDRWKWITELRDKTQGILTKIGLDKRYSFQVLQGKFIGEGSFKEEPASPKVYFAFKFTFGYLPLFGVDFKQPIPWENLFGIAYIPPLLKQYSAEINLFVRLQGKVEAKGTGERVSTQSWDVSGGGGGLVAGGVVGEFKILDGKLLHFQAEGGWGLTSSLSLFKKNTQREGIFGEFKAETSELAVTAKWTLLNGKIEPGSRKKVIFGKQNLIGPLKVPIAGG